MAAYREVAEEAGLTDLKLMADLGDRQRLDYSKKRWKKIHYFLFITAQIEGKPTDTTYEYQLSCYAFKPPIPLAEPFGELGSRQKFKGLTAYIGLTSKTCHLFSGPNNKN
ncbi:MAG: NUDIX domain-containing protein [Spirulinaceae cyanobacterium]